VAGTGPSDLYDLAQEYLSACIDALDSVATEDATLLGAPDRSFVTYANPAFDCPQLTVHVVPITESPSIAGGPMSAKTLRINLITLVATSIRCVPDTTNMTQEEEAARQLHADAWALWNHIFNMIRAGAFKDKCTEVWWDGLRPVPAQGGVAGWTLQLRVQLDGYSELIGT